MALVVKDRVKEVTTTTGTADLTLGGAVYGFQSFAIIGNGNTTYYAIYDSATGDWEVGIGTYTTAGPTLTRTTVFESSNSGSKVVFGAGTKDVFVTYPAERAVYLDAAGSAVTLLDVGTLGVGTANITTANITAGTISTTPTNNTDIVNKQYADAIASGIHFHEAVGYATTAALPAVTYNNGTGGVGATLTANANGALTVDGYTFVSPADNGTRILIKNQADGAQNGVYTLTQAGNSSPGAPFILTRATDFDSVGTGVDQIDEGDFFLVTGGTANANTAWVQQTPPPITIGTTAIVFQQFSAPITYTAGTGLSESPSYTFNIANIGTAGTYGTASQVPVFVTNAQGQVTSVTNTGIAISAGAVSGLAASATTDTTNASNITSGTLPVARLSGSYTGITGVGTLAAGTWNASTIGVAYGGTGITSYTVGDLLYADGATSLAKLADVATGNALISGGVGTAPAWGKIGLQTHVSGTLQLVNGGTGATDASGARSNLGLVIGTDIPSVTGSGASGTWNINITGNAATATTSTTSTTATQVSNSVTFNNSGAGAASGNGFNGSGALTVSYNTIGAPSTTGANASGTWSINITGNAASATSAPNYLPLAGGTMTGVLNMSGTQTITFAGFAGIEYYNAAGTWQGYVGTENNSGNLRYNSRLGTHTWYANSTSIGSWNASALNSLVALQQNGNQVLHAGNYNSYAPTLTGGGASGTWGISITGTSSNITAYTINQNLGTGNSPTFVGLNLSGNLLQLGGVNALNRGATWTEFYDPSGATKLWLGNNASIYMNASNYYLRSNDSSATWVDINASLLSHTSSLRAPIFYDSNNTGYYVDAASTSVFNRLNLVGFDSTGRNYSREWIEFPNFSGLYSPNNGAHFYPNNVSSHGPWVIQGSRGSYGGIFDDFADVNGIMYDSAGNGGAYREANGRWYFYYSLGNDCMGIGTSTTSSAYSLYLNKGVYAQSRIDATIFYDTNDTNYYVDPNSNSKLVNLGLGGATPDVRLSVSGDAHISTYLYMGGTAGSSGSWSSRLISSGGATTLNTSTFLVDRTGYGGGGSFNMDTAGNCFASSSFRAPIFYDSNDTTYYIDPASFTNVFGGIQNSGAHATSYIQNRLLAANNGASTGEVQLRMWCSEPGVTWDWAGFGYNVYNDGGSPGGFGRPNTNFGQAYMRFGTSGDLIFYNTTTGASRSTTMQLHSTGYVTAFQSSRAPIFYDTDNTGYYLDPNSTTALRTVGSWRADSATWDGEFSGKIQYHSSYWYFQSASGWFFRNSGGTNVMTCDSSGNVTFSANVTAYSDRHKKDNIVTLESAASYLDRIDARRFDWKDSGRADIGFIAQEVEESGLSMFVHENQIIDPDTDEVLDTVKSLDYGRMTAVLWQAVKELKAELNALRAH